jgi:hypothetical protein
MNQILHMSSQSKKQISLTAMSREMMPGLSAVGQFRPVT